jgi:aspartate-semialdehyde dehydrogenase
VSVLAVLHPTNLLGKELRERLESRGDGPHWTELRLLSTQEDEIGTLTEVGGAAAIVQRYEPDSLEGVDAVFFCGPIAANRPVLAEIPAGVTAVVLSPDATSGDGMPVVAGVNTAAASRGAVLLSPHPAVVLLAHLLRSLSALAPREAVGTVIQPASQHDTPGVEELFEQTRQIVAMTQRRRSQVFGAQLAFNLLPATVPAETVTEALAAVLDQPGHPAHPASNAGVPRRPRARAGTSVPVSLQLLQGGFFHGLAASLLVRFAGDAGLPALRRALAGWPYLQLAGDPRHLGPIDAAASDRILIGTPRKDAQGGGVWLWAVMDNLTRGGALNAVEIAAATL